MLRNKYTHNDIASVNTSGSEEEFTERYGLLETLAAQFDTHRDATEHDRLRAEELRIQGTNIRNAASSAPWTSPTTAPCGHPNEQQLDAAAPENVELGVGPNVRQLHDAAGRPMQNRPRTSAIYKRGNSHASSEDSLISYLEEKSKRKAVTNEAEIQVRLLEAQARMLEAENQRSLLQYLQRAVAASKDHAPVLHNANTADNTHNSPAASNETNDRLA